MPVIIFSLKGNMNKKNLKDGLRNNFGMSPLVIILIVLVVLVLGGLGYGFYAYSTNPFIKVYESLSKFNNIKDVKSFEISGIMSVDFNLAKILQSSNSSAGTFKPVYTDKELSILDQNTTLSINVNGKYDLEKDKILSNCVFLVKNFKLDGEFKDVLDSNGTVLDASYYMEGFQNYSKDREISKYYMKINKLPNSIPLPTGDKLNLSFLTGQWIDLTQMFNQSTKSSTNNLDNKSTSNADSSKLPSSVFFCEKKVLSLVDKIQLGRLLTSDKVFSKAVNMGTVDLEGVKATQLDFQIDLKNKNEIANALDEMTKIACKESSGVNHQKFVDGLAKDLGVSTINLSYFIDNKTGYIAKYMVEVMMNEKKFNSKFNLKTEVIIKNMNNTSVESPSNVVPVSKIIDKITEMVTPKPTPSMSLMTSSSASTYGCQLPQKEIDSFMRICRSSRDIFDIAKDVSGMCNCMVTQQQSVACSDKAGFDRRVNQYCAKYLR